MNDTDYDLILKENRRRLYILSNYYLNNNWIHDYDLYKDLYIDHTKKLITKISYSNSYIRKFILHDDSIPTGNYHISKSRIDYYNGYIRQSNNSSIIFKLLQQIDTNKESVYFFTVDYTISSEFLNADIYLNNLKSIYKNLIHTKIFDLISGMILKYEVSYSLDNGLLRYIPHSHFLLKCNKSVSSQLINDLTLYLRKYLSSSQDNLIHYTEITYNKYSYNSLSKYISKDFYYSIFHFKDRSKNLDSFIVPQPHIITLLYKTSKFQFFTSYKDFRFNQTI